MTHERGALPPGWVWTTLGDVTHINPRDPGLRALPDSLPVSFVPMAAVDAELGAIGEPAERPLSQVRKGYTAFGDHDVLFAKITPCMENGKAAIAKNLTNGLGFGSTEFHVLRPSVGVLSEWVYHFVRQTSFRRDARAHFAGTAGQLRVPASFLESTEIALPPLPEQRRIVAEIEKQFTRLDAGVAALKRVQANLKRYRASVLKAACEGRLAPQDPNDEPADRLLARILAERRAKWEAEHPGKKYVEPAAPMTDGLPDLPAGWCWAVLPQVGELARGKSKHRPRNDPRLYGGPYPFVQTGDIKKADGTITAHSQTYNEVGLTQSRLWPKGTLCITIAANIAETAILGFDACFPDSVVGFLGTKDACDVRFVEYFIRTAKDDLERYAPATAQKNINLDTLEKLAIALPPLPEQHRIVAEVERRLSVVAALEATVAANLARAGRLRQAVLKRAFEGRLVAKDAGDEPTQDPEAM